MLPKIETCPMPAVKAPNYIDLINLCCVYLIMIMHKPPLRQIYGQDFLAKILLILPFSFFYLPKHNSALQILRLRHKSFFGHLFGCFFRCLMLIQDECVVTTDKLYLLKFLFPGIPRQLKFIVLLLTLILFKMAEWKYRLVNTIT